MKKSGIIGGVIVALVLIFGLIAAITCLEKVPTGYLKQSISLLMQTTEFEVLESFKLKVSELQKVIEENNS